MPKSPVEKSNYLIEKSNKNLKGVEMSKSAVEKINKDKVSAGLLAVGMTQKELALKIDMAPKALTRALSRGRIAAHLLDAIGQVLDLAPEYLSDNPYMPEDFPHNYIQHLLQDTRTEWKDIITNLWIRCGYYPDDIDADTFWGMKAAIEAAADEYIKRVHETTTLRKI